MEFTDKSTALCEHHVSAQSAPHYVISDPRMIERHLRYIAYYQNTPGGILWFSHGNFHTFAEAVQWCETREQRRIADARN
jgi:hypothetical protein